MSRALFISDLHLDESTPKGRSTLLYFLKTIASNAESLFVLGDLFESWVGDDNTTEYNQSIINAFRELTQTGTALYFMHGNRDFLLGSEFTGATGGTLLDDPIVVDLYGHKTLLMHGDTLCTDDQAYLEFRQQVRSLAWINETLTKPLEERLAIAQHMRMESQKHNQNKAENIMDAHPDEILKQMQQHKVQHLIHGHTHRPETHQLECNSLPATRYVLGDWHSQGWYLEVTEDDFKLKAFPLQSA